MSKMQPYDRNIPYNNLPELPPPDEKVITIEILQALNKANKAFRNFEKSVKAGLKYECKLELSRTYFEAGKFLQDTKNSKKRIDGLNGVECLLKARSMFEEMNLEWDLKEYHKYMEGESS